MATGHKQKTFKRQFRFEKGKSKKFWAIELLGKTQILRFGRIGSQGQVKQRLFADVESANKACAKLIAAKLAKGYREVKQASNTTRAASPDLNELFQRPYKGKLLAPLRDAELKRTEHVLGVRLPKAYVDLMRRRNGGSLRYDGYLLKRAPTNSFHMKGRAYSFSRIAGVHRSEWDCLPQIATAAQECGVPKELIAFDGDSHWWICFDYRKCGRKGEPRIVHWDQPDMPEELGPTFHVADTFQQLLDGLQFGEPSFIFALDGQSMDRKGLAGRLKELGCRKLPRNHEHWEWRKYQGDLRPVDPASMFVFDNGSDDPWHLARPKGHRLLLVGVSVRDQQECIGRLLEAFGDEAELIHQPIDRRPVRLKSKSNPKSR